LAVDTGAIELSTRKEATQSLDSLDYADAELARCQTKNSAHTTALKDAEAWILNALES
jgi:hypothetical protein